VSDRPEPPEPPEAPGPPVIDPRPYRWAIGIFGLVAVVAISIYQFAEHGLGTTGIPRGQRLHYFAAPLAASTLNGDANLQPPCTPARHDPRALNLCLLGARMPVVLAFFVTGSSDCTRQVDALQSLSLHFPASAVSFAAVAVHAGHAQTAALVRSHHWTIPVAYDPDGSVGSLYGVVICPMIELAYRGGIVKDRLIGDRWVTAAAIGPFVRSLLLSGPGARLTPATGGD
jgi:peroxiredoxin